MHIITRKRIIEFGKKYPDTVSALDNWYRIVKSTDFENFAHLKDTFNSVDKVGELTVFNISGNKVRLIVAIHYNRKKMYIRGVLTHREYEKGDWKKRI